MRKSLSLPYSQRKELPHTLPNGNQLGKVFLRNVLISPAQPMRRSNWWISPWMIIGSGRVACSAARSPASQAASMSFWSTPSSLQNRSARSMVVWGCNDMARKFYLPTASQDLSDIKFQISSLMQVKIHDSCFHCIPETSESSRQRSFEDQTGRRHQRQVSLTPNDLPYCKTMFGMTLPDVMMIQ